MYTIIYELEARMKFIFEAQQSAQHFEATGLHIPLEELDKWVNDIEQNSNESISKCHK